jgi:hypothetical protein
LARAGESFLTALGPSLAAADPGGLVGARSRLLCSGLGLVSQLCYEAAGGAGGHEGEVGLVGAQLSLLTKLDDEVIDAPAFHGVGRGRGRLRGAVAAYLEPTLRSLREARPATGEPRARFAAELGARFASLAATRARLAHLLDVVADGFDVQAEAVAVLTAPPAEVSATEVATVTARISGAWLRMIALCGTLPGDARPLSPGAEAAFEAWGWHVQRADALADLGKDVRDGLVSTLPLHSLWGHDPGLYRRALAAGPADVYREVGALALDRACLPAPGALDALAARTAELGRLPSLFAWVHRMLVGRYLDHPLARPSAGLVASARARAGAPLAASAGPRADAPSNDRAPRGAEGAPCSAL